MVDNRFYEGITLTAISQLQAECAPTSVDNLVERARVGNKTIIKAVYRLAEQGRIAIIEVGPAKARRFKIIDPPGEYDQMALTLHLASREG